jgi:hypothetical protein
MTTQMKIYRRSELETIAPQQDSEGCLFRYKAIWIDGVDDTSDVALLGIGFAAIQHRYIVSLVDNQVGQDFDLAIAAYAAGVASAQTPSRLLPELRQLWQFHAETWELPLERFVAAEERGSVGDVGFTPDLVLAHSEKNALEVIDDKSGWHPPLTEDALKGLFQARVYSRYARDRWPNFSKYLFTLHAVRFKKTTTVEFTNEELDQVELEVQGAIATIEEAKRADHWPATPGPSCHFCTLACPVAEQAIALPVRLPREMVPKLAAWLLVADKQLKAAKKLMKASVATYGPVTVNGVEWDNRPSESLSYPIQSLMDVLQLRGGMGAFEDPDLTISRSALKKLFKAYPGLEDDLAGAVKTKTAYRFGPKRPTNPELDAITETEEA